MDKIVYVIDDDGVVRDGKVAKATIHVDKLNTQFYYHVSVFDTGNTLYIDPDKLFFTYEDAIRHVVGPEKVELQDGKIIINV